MNMFQKFVQKKQDNEMEAMESERTMDIKKMREEQKAMGKKLIIANILPSVLIWIIPFLGERAQDSLGVLLIFATIISVVAYIDYRAVQQILKRYISFVIVLPIWMWLILGLLALALFRISVPIMFFVGVTLYFDTFLDREIYRETDRERYKQINLHIMKETIDSHIILYIGISVLLVIFLLQCFVGSVVETSDYAFMPLLLNVLRVLTMVLYCCLSLFIHYVLYLSFNFYENFVDIETNDPNDIWWGAVKMTLKDILTLGIRTTILAKVNYKQLLQTDVNDLYCEDVQDDLFDE